MHAVLQVNDTHAYDRSIGDTPIVIGSLGLAALVSSRSVEDSAAVRIAARARFPRKLMRMRRIVAESGRTFAIRAAFLLDALSRERLEAFVALAGSEGAPVKIRSGNVAQMLAELEGALALDSGLRVHDRIAGLAGDEMPASRRIVHVLDVSEHPRAFLEGAVKMLSAFARRWRGGAVAIRIEGRAVDASEARRLVHALMRDARSLASFLGHGDVRRHYAIEVRSSSLRRVLECEGVVFQSEAYMMPPHAGAEPELFCLSIAGRLLRILPAIFRPRTRPPTLFERARAFLK